MDFKKIFEIKGQDLLKGLSIQSDFPLGGLFQAAANFNPFEKMGLLQPSLASTVVDATTITTQVNHLIPYVNAVGYAFALGDRSGTGAKTLYNIRLSDLVVTDISTIIDTNAATGAVTHGGGIIYKSRLIYEQSGSMRSISLALSSDTNILTSANTNTTLPTDFVIGSDLNLYFTAHNANAIGKIVTVNATTNNTDQAFILGTGIIPRSLTSDGYYVAAIGDDNDGKLTTVTSKCKVYFWDKAKSTADVIWDIPDAYLIGARFVDGQVLIIGYSGIWACNLHTPPKLIKPLTPTQLPSSPSQIDATKDFLYWASAATGTTVYAYGSLIGKPILFTPYTSSASTDLHTALAITGDQLLAATDHPSVYMHNTGSTRAAATLRNATAHLGNTYEFGFIKCVLKAPLSSGQSVIINVTDGNGRVIMDTTTKSYSDADVGAKKGLRFGPKPLAGVSTPDFEDLVLTMTTNSANIKRISVYGVAQEDVNQDS